MIQFSEEQPRQHPKGLVSRDLGFESKIFAMGLEEH